MVSEITIYRAKTILPMAGEKPARGKALLAPLAKIDNAAIIVHNDKIVDITRGLPILPAHAQLIDMGPVCLFPRTTNAHAHLSLSWLAGKTLWRKGFVSWLKSMVPLILAAPPDCFKIPDSPHLLAVKKACQYLKDHNCRCIGDIGGSIPGALTAVSQSSRDADLDLVSFCEWIGWQKIPGGDPWPPRCATELGASANPAPCGHALYSTSPEIMRSAHAWCVSNRKPFAFHLAESPEETEMLLYGKGTLRDFYEGKLLPPDWRPPYQRPFQFAKSLGILTPRSVAVHGAQMDKKEIAQFAATGASLCLCPRSNKNLGVGKPLFREWLASDILLCLGTDGLTSNTDLDPLNEAIYLKENEDLPSRALLRMLVVNGARALGLSPATISRGMPAKFAVLPETLNDALH